MKLSDLLSEAKDGDVYSYQKNKVAIIVGKGYGNSLDAVIFSFRNPRRPSLDSPSAQIPEANLEDSKKIKLTAKMKSQIKQVLDDPEESGSISNNDLSKIKRMVGA